MHLHSILHGAHSYLAPAAALAGLDTALAAEKPYGAPHSIAEIVAHMTFWQRWFLDRCDGHDIPPPVPASLGWPGVGDEEWDTVLGRFEDGFQRAIALANDQARRGQALSPALEFGPLRYDTTTDVLIHLSLHNAHHVGQVITLRQQLGAWPPPAGSWTW